MKNSISMLLITINFALAPITTYADAIIDSDSFKKTERFFIPMEQTYYFQERSTFPADHFKYSISELIRMGKIPSQSDGSILSSYNEADLPAGLKRVVDMKERANFIEDATYDLLRAIAVEGITETSIASGEILILDLIEKYYSSSKYNGSALLNGTVNSLSDLVDLALHSVKQLGMNDIRYMTPCYNVAKSVWAGKSKPIKRSQVPASC